jgi:hypothetical protein
MLPALKNLHESILRRLPTSEIFQPNAALVKEQKSASKIQAKLKANAECATAGEQPGDNGVWLVCQEEGVALC